MKATLPAAIFFCLTCPVIADDAAPAAAVKHAVAALQDSSGYAWRITMETGGRSGFSPGPVEGKILRDGTTQWTFHFGERKVEAFLKGDQAAVNTGDGWNRPAGHPENRGEKAPPPPPPPQDDASRPKPPPHDGRRGHKPPGGHRGNKDGFFLQRLRAMKTPAALSSELLGKLSALHQQGDVITGTLQPEAAAELLATGSHSRDKGCISGAQGTITWTLADKRLQSIGLQLSATFSFNENKVPVSLASRIEVTETGLMSLDIPVEATRLLTAGNAPATTPTSKP